MNTQQDETNPPREEECLRCERCGKPGASRIGDHQLCVDCYAALGSCCVEFGGEDLWEDEKEATAGPKKFARETREMSRKQKLQVVVELGRLVGLRKVFPIADFVVSSRADSPLSWATTSLSSVTIS